MTKQKLAYVCKCGSLHWFGAGDGDESGGLTVTIVCGCGQELMFILREGISLVAASDCNYEDCIDKLKNDSGTPVRELLEGTSK